MSGHSKWATTHRHKAVVDAKRGAIFTKLGNQIAIAARGGTDPSINSALALAIEKAKAANMPNANIQRAIDRVNDKNAAVLEEITYEGYGPQGVGLIIETATDNRNRTLPEVKTALVKNGGRLADSGSVMFQFERKGVIVIESKSEDDMLEILSAGGEEVEEILEEEGQLIIQTDQKNLAKVRQSLIDAGFKIKDAELQYIANNDIEITDQETADKITKIIDVLEDLDDVSNVYTNAQFKE